MFSTTKMEKIVKEIYKVKKYYTTKAMQTDAFTNIESEEMNRLWGMFHDLDEFAVRIMEEAMSMDTLIMKMDTLVRIIEVEES